MHSPPDNEKEDTLSCVFAFIPVYGNMLSVPDKNRLYYGLTWTLHRRQGWRMCLSLQRTFFSFVSYRGQEQERKKFAVS
jgi:hypothetical protein